MYICKKEIDESIFLRASLSSVCNFNCIYCPKELGMENQVPDMIKGKRLTIDEYIQNLKLFSISGIKSITFTGGEPALNKELEIILKEAKKLFNNIEITTNGYNFKENILIYEKYIDKIKLSLDAIDYKKFKNITNTSFQNLFDIQESLEISAKKNLNLTLNIVVMKENLQEISKIINFCSHLNKKYKSNISISLLDLYYVPTKRDFWISNFIPLNIVRDFFLNKNYYIKKDNKFGCNFYWIYNDSINIRFKDSFSATHRSNKCDICPSYCQEGVYSIKHSLEGYCTTCPFIVNDIEDIYLSKDMPIEESLLNINKIIDTLIYAKLEINSFEKFMFKNNLSKKNINFDRDEIFHFLEGNND